MNKKNGFSLGNNSIIKTNSSCYNNMSRLPLPIRYFIHINMTHGALSLYGSIPHIQALILHKPIKYDTPETHSLKISIISLWKFADIPPSLIGLPTNMSSAPYAYHNHASFETFSLILTPLNSYHNPPPISCNPPPPPFHP